MRQTRILTEGAMACAVFATLLIISVYLPLISLVSLWFLPLPFAVYTIRHGIRPGLVAFLAGLFLGFILSALPGLIWALTFGSGGVTTGWLYRQKRTAFAVLLGGSLVYIANVLFIYILSIVLLQTDIIQDSIDLVRKSIEQAQNMAGALGGAEENLKFLDAYLRQLKYFAPTLLVSAGVIYAFLTQWVQGRVLRKIGFAEYVLPWKPFREWQLPKSILWYYLAVLLLLFFTSPSLPFPFTSFKKITFMIRSLPLLSSHRLLVLTYLPPHQATSRQTGLPHSLNGPRRQSSP